MLDLELHDCFKFTLFVAFLILTSAIYLVNKDYYYSAVFATATCPSVRLSVRLTHAGIVSKRLNLS